MMDNQILRNHSLMNMSEVETLFAKYFRNPNDFTSQTSIQLVSDGRLYATFGNLWRSADEAKGKPVGRYFTLWGWCKDGTVACSDAWYIDHRFADYTAHKTMHVLEAEQVRRFEQDVFARSMTRGGLILKVRTLAPVSAPQDLSQLSFDATDRG